MSMFPNSSALPLDYSRDAEKSRFMVSFFNSVYAWMFAGLAVTALVGWLMSQSPAALHMVYGSRLGYTALGLGAFMIAMATQRIAMTVNATAATALFILYAAVIGALVSGIFVIYPTATLAASFLVTGATFGVMSVMGFVFKTDLTKIGSYLIMAAIGLFVASIVNIFLANDALSWFITYAVLLVFMGLTIYYTQMLKGWALSVSENPAMAPRLAIVGSLMLYVAFINMFLSILRIMGNRR